MWYPDTLTANNTFTRLVFFNDDRKVNWNLYDDVFDNRLASSQYDHNILMRCTTKSDKDGVEIYDGDIIEFDRKEWGGDGNIHVVSWDSHNAEWSWGGGVTGDMEWRKVIGNIYQNPELLKQ